MIPQKNAKKNCKDICVGLWKFLKKQKRNNSKFAHSLLYQEMHTQSKINIYLFILQ